MDYVFTAGAAGGGMGMDAVLKNFQGRRIQSSVYIEAEKGISLCIMIRSPLRAISDIDTDKMQVESARKKRHSNREGRPYHTQTEYTRFNHPYRGRNMHSTLSYTSPMKVS